MLSLIKCLKSHCRFGMRPLFTLFRSSLYMYKWVAQGVVLAEFLTLTTEKNYFLVHKIKLLKTIYSCLSKRKNPVMKVKNIPCKFQMNIVHLGSIFKW